MRACFDCSNSPALTPSSSQTSRVADLRGISVPCKLPEWPAIPQGIGDSVRTAAASAAALHSASQHARASKDLISTRNWTQVSDWIFSPPLCGYLDSATRSTANPIFSLSFFSLFAFQSTVDAIFPGIFCQKTYPSLLAPFDSSTGGCHPIRRFRKMSLNGL